MKFKSSIVPGAYVDIVHGGVIKMLEVHDVIVTRWISIGIKHHNFIHIPELEIAEIFLFRIGEKIKYAFEI